MARTLRTAIKPIRITYQLNGTGIPVAPSLDNPGIDIDQDVKGKAASFLEGITDDTNSYPILLLPGSTTTTPPPYGTNFGNISSQNTQQPQFSPEFLADSTNAGTEGAPWFDPVFVHPDKLGTYEKSPINKPRTFSAQNYISSPATRRIIDEVLLSNTGRNAANKFSTPATRAGSLPLGSTAYQSLGAYNKASYLGQPIREGAGAPSGSVITTGMMQQLAWNIMFDSVQGDAGFDFKITSPSDFTEAEGRMAIPSPQRLGKKVKLSRFTPKTVMQKLNPSYNPNNETTNSFVDNDNDVNTNGSFYNPYAQFDSLISIGQIALAIALILGFVILMDLIGVILRAADSTPDVTGLNEKPAATSFAGLTAPEKKQLLGSSTLRDIGGTYPTSRLGGGDIIAQMLGVDHIFVKTFHDAGDTLLLGISEFFGFSFASGVRDGGGAAGSGPQQLASTALRVLTESGRLVTTLREIVRSGISVVEDGIADFSGGFSIAAIGNLIRKIRDLKIIKFINILRTMGDKVKFEDDLRRQARLNGGGAFLGQSANISYVDTLPDERRFLISKSRLSDGGATQGGIAWSTTTAGMLSLPLNIFSWALQDAGFPYLAYNELPGENRGLKPVGDRMSAEDVAEYESELEMDYMPFYIHDLRTNEILSFHAFLEDASDDFSIEYSAQEGYGRLDKVQIYKGTTRTVNVSFKMIATSEDDHAVMWYKLNKLVTVIYPQWTQGREINAGGGINFIQPLSQIPGATPVIRLRLGDLWKSNYSKMAVKRLFGATTLNNYSVDGDLAAQPSAPPQDDPGRPTPMPSPPANPTQTPATAPALPASSARGGHAATASPPHHNHRQSSTGRSSTVASVASNLVVNQIVILKRAHGFPHIDAYLSAENGGVRGSTASIPRQAVQTQDTRYKATYDGPDDVLQRGRTVQGFNFTVIGINVEGTGTAQNYTATEPQPIFLQATDLAHLSPYIDDERTRPFIPYTTSTPSNVTQQPSSTAAAATSMTAAEFYNDTKNPLIKAFKSSGGQGLAGVITSFKIDNKGSTWGTNRSSKLRAPKMVTITLAMAVIHDITPGLDARGIMNAPIWPIGEYSNYFMQNGDGGTELPPLPPANPDANGSIFDPVFNPKINRRG